jgi:NADPH:quinone reductase-like Zn-dependent oxidoreductase
VVGTGGVSLAALAFARLAGARVVIAARTDAHHAALRALGAAHVVTTTSERWPAEVAAWAGGGVDLALDVVGGRSLAGCIAATRTGGHVHGVGYVADTTATIDIFEAIRHATTLHVATAGPRTSFEALARAMELHATRPTIGARFPRARLRDAFTHLGQRGILGKVVVEL